MNKAQYVDPIIGTVADGQIEESHGGGKTYPGACVPGGVVQMSPDTITGDDNGSGYNYCHNTIEGFSLNHLSGIGWYGDLGNIQIMPVVGETDLRSGSNLEIPFVKGHKGWKSDFTHEKESARAGYYSVMLDTYGILAEATSTVHTGVLRFTYPQNSDSRVIFNFSRRIGGKADFQTIDIINDHRIEGHIHCTPAGGGFGRGDGGIFYDVYFVCESSVPFSNARFFSAEDFAEEGISHYESEDAGLLVSFDDLNDNIVLQCAISYVDMDGARKNFDAESCNFDFDKVAADSFDSWNKIFEGINVEGSDEVDLKLFYTCLYHVLLDPRVCADTDGRFVLHNQVFNESEYIQRSVFSGWDVYRSEFPLLTIIRPDIVNDEVNSLLKIAELTNSSFPRWELLGIDASCMVGDPGTIVVADAFVKGIRGFDTQKAYEFAKASSLCLTEKDGKPFHSVRPYCKEYIEKNYVPEKLSDTLEFLLADYTLSRFAEGMGYTEDAGFFKDRAMRYAENYNHQLQFMAPRYADGSFVFEEDRYDDDGTVESNIFQQSWFVPHDVVGLSKLFGEERTLELLEVFFEKADLKSLWNDDYNHSNEPCHNITHYFNILGKPSRTQYWTRRVQKEAYRTGAYGFCGNEDVGQLSAWYVLSALGFAQVCPADDRYYINTPLFKECSVRLDKAYHTCSADDKLTVVCDKDTLKYPYIKECKFNGKKVTDCYLTYNEITAGGKLEFTLSAEPCDSFIYSN